MLSIVRLGTIAFCLGIAFGSGLLPLLVGTPPQQPADRGVPLAPQPPVALPHAEAP